MKYNFYGRNENLIINSFGVSRRFGFVNVFLIRKLPTIIGRLIMLKFYYHFF